MNKKIITILLLSITCLSFLFAESNSSVKVAIDIDSAYQSIMTHNIPNNYLTNINDLASKVNLSESFEMQKDILCKISSLHNFSTTNIFSINKLHFQICY